MLVVSLVTLGCAAGFAVGRLRLHRQPSTTVIVWATLLVTVVLTIAVWNGWPPVGLDRSVATAVADNGAEWSTRVLRLVTRVGSAPVIVGMTVLAAVAESRREKSGRGNPESRPVGPVWLFLAVVVGGQSLIVNVMKPLIGRSRPALDQLTAATGASFPSGHSAAVAATLGGLALVLGRRRKRRAGADLWGGAVGVAVVVAGSRVLLGVHWLTDTVAGLALGWAWLAGCVIAFSRLHVGECGYPSRACGVPA